MACNIAINIWRSLQIIDHLLDTHLNALILAIDVEKAFGTLQRKAFDTVIEILICCYG